MKQKMDLCEIFEQINEAMRMGDFAHHEVIEQFKEFIDDTLMLKVEFELSESDIQKLEAASVALNRACEVILFKEDNETKRWSDKLKCFLYKTNINGKDVWVTIPDEQ